MQLHAFSCSQSVESHSTHFLSALTIFISRNTFWLLLLCFVFLFTNGQSVSQLSVTLIVYMGQIRGNQGGQLRKQGLFCLAQGFKGVCPCQADCIVLGPGVGREHHGGEQEVPIPAKGMQQREEGEKQRQGQRGDGWIARENLRQMNNGPGFQYPLKSHTQSFKDSFL